MASKMKARKYLAEELNDVDEVTTAINRLENIMANESNALRDEVERLNDIVTTKKKKGSVSLRALIVLAVMATAAFGQSYVRDDVNYDIVSNPESLTTFLDDVLNTGTFVFTPIASPSGNDIVEGKIYYDSSSNGWFGSDDGSTWTQFDTGGGVSLDGSYNIGSTIDVDSDALTFTTSDTDNNVVMALVQNEATNDNAALTITFGSGATGTAISINSQANGTDIAGDNWSIDQAGKLTILEIAQTGDVLFNGTTYDVAFDASREGLVAEDNAIIGFGATVHNDAPDMTFSCDGTNVLVEVASQDAADLVFGATNALDIVVYNDAADSTVTFDNSGELVSLNGWDILLQDSDVLNFGDDSDITIAFDGGNGDLDITCDDLEIAFGADGAGGDIVIFSEAASSKVTFTEATDDMLFVAYDIDLDDNSNLIIGSDNEWSIDNASENLRIIPSDTDDDFVVAFGNATNTTDLLWYTKTASSIITIDASADEMDFDGIDLRFDDGDFLKFGDSSDFTITSDGTAVLKIATLATNESPIVHIGADEAGSDVRFYPATTAEYMEWDAGNEALEFVGAQAHFDDTSILQFGSDKDFSVYSDTALTLEFDPLVAGNTIKFGTANTDAVDIIWYSDSSGDTVTFNEEDIGVEFEDVVLQMMDDTAIVFGDADDVTLEYDEDGENGLQVTGAMFGALRVVQNHTASDTLTQVESGKVHLVQNGTSGGNGPSDVVLTLPTAVAGIEYFIVDPNETAAADVTITAGASDTINGGAAAASIVHDTDAETSANVHLLAIDATQWIIVSSSGTWTAE